MSQSTEWFKEASKKARKEIREEKRRNMGNSFKCLFVELGITEEGMGMAQQLMMVAGDMQPSSPNALNAVRQNLSRSLAIFHDFSRGSRI